MEFTLLVWACPVDISRHVMDHLSHQVGSEEALNLVMPFLEKIAARDKMGRPCVTKVGTPWE